VTRNRTSNVSFCTTLARPKDMNLWGDGPDNILAGWGDDSADFVMTPIRTKRKNNTRKNDKKPSPIDTHSDPTAMLIKYNKQHSPLFLSMESSSQIRPWSRGEDLIHRGWKKAEANKNKKGRSFGESKEAENWKRCERSSSIVFQSEPQPVTIINGLREKTPPPKPSVPRMENIIIEQKTKTRGGQLDKLLSCEKKIQISCPVTIPTPPRRSPQVKHLMQKITAGAALSAKQPTTFSVIVRIVSAGMHDGDKAEIFLNDENVSPNERGFNIVVLKSTTLTVSYTKAFNTHDNDSASTKMARFLNNLPYGAVVLIAVRTDATAHACGECVKALQLLGARSFRPGFGGSWAFCGIKGESRSLQRSMTRFHGPATIVQSFTTLRSVVDEDVAQSSTPPEAITTLSRRHILGCKCLECRTKVPLVNIGRRAKQRSALYMMGHDASTNVMEIAGKNPRANELENLYEAKQRKYERTESMPGPYGANARNEEGSESSAVLEQMAAALKHKNTRRQLSRNRKARMDNDGGIVLRGSHLDPKHNKSTDCLGGQDHSREKTKGFQSVYSMPVLVAGASIERSKKPQSFSSQKQNRILPLISADKNGANEDTLLNTRQEHAKAVYHKMAHKHRFNYGKYPKDALQQQQHLTVSSAKASQRLARHLSVSTSASH
jgi:hypothetical protein